MFTKNFKLDGIESILDNIGYLDEMHGAGEDQEHKYPKKSGKKSKDYDGDGTKEDETDEYAGVKDKAIKKNIRGYNSDEQKARLEKKRGMKLDDHTKYKKEEVDFSSVLDELTDEDLLFLTDDLIEEVVSEFFYETLEEGFEIDELETLLIEQVDSEFTYLEEAKITTGHDTDEETPEASRPSKLSKIKDAVKKVASGAKNVAKKVAKGAGEVAGSAVAGFKAASASSNDDTKPSGGSSSGGSSSSGSSSGGSSSSGSSSGGTKRPGILGRVGSALKAGLKKVVKGAGKVAGKVVKTAKAGYDEGRGKEAPAPASAPAAKPTAAKPTAAKPTAVKKKAGGNLDNLLNKIRNESYQQLDEISPDLALKASKAADVKRGKLSVAGDKDGAAAKAAQASRLYKAQANKRLNRQIGEEAELLDEISADLALKASKAADVKRGKLASAGDKEGAAAKSAQAGRLYKAQAKQRLGEDLSEACWKGYEAIGMKMKGDKKVPNCVPKEEYVDLERDLLEEGYTFEQVLEVISAYEDGFEVIFEEDGVTINETQEILDEDTEFLSDIEMLADWLHAEGVIEDEDEFFGLMEELSEEEIQDLYDLVHESTAMAKKGYDETEIRTKIAKNTGGGKTADKATALADQPTYGNKEKKAGRENLARKQRGDFRKTTSSSPGLHGYGHKSDDPKVKAKQAARGAQRGALTPNEKKSLGREGYQMIGNTLEEGGLEVTTYSWHQVLEQQYARNNPEKYEAEQKKKTPKGSMPPRGDKRREEFEKWYAANVK